MTADDPTRALDDQVAGCAQAHQRLLGFLDELVEQGQVRSTDLSLLPGWTIGHVLTHLARNADGFRNMIEGAAAGEIRSMYVSREQRDIDIEAGASRPLATIVGDCRAATWALESSWARLTMDAWHGFGTTRTGPTAIIELPWRRWREVEVHHADLGLAFTPEDWSAAFVAAGLADAREEWRGRATALPDEVASASDRQQLARLLGRPSGLSTPAPSWG